jgi:hypothetical protein
MDFYSIMMYPSDTGSYNNFDDTMVKVENGHSWPLPRTITTGDGWWVPKSRPDGGANIRSAQAVKRLYPDNKAPEDQAPGK